MTNNTVKFAAMTARDTTRRALRQIEMAIAVLEYQREVRSTHAERITLDKYAEYLMRDAIDGMSKVITSAANAIETMTPAYSKSELEEPDDLPF